MVEKIISKIGKLFFSFLCLAMLSGIIFFMIRNYTTPVVSSVPVSFNSTLYKKYYFEGTVKPKKYIEIKAPEKMYIDDIYVRTGEVVIARDPILKLDMTKQTIEINSNISSIKSSIKGIEIEKLSMHNQIEASKKSIENLKKDYDKQLEEYNNLEVMYKNNIVTKKELDEKKDYVDSCLDIYNQAVKNLDDELVIYNMSLSKLDIELQALNTQLKLEQEDSKEENQIIVSEDGVFTFDNIVYIDYINYNNIIEKDDIILKYAIYNDDNDLKLVCEMDDELEEVVTDEKTNIYYYKNYYKNKVRTTCKGTKMLSDCYEVYFNFIKNPFEKIRVSNKIQFIAEEKRQGAAVVPVSAILPIGPIVEKGTCYVYIIQEEETILGKDNYIIECQATIDFCSGNKVSIFINDEEGRINSEGNINVVKFATSILKDGIRVRVE